MFHNIYAKKRVLVTGHTGFKGSWLMLWLEHLNAETLGYSLEPDTSPSMHTIVEGKGVYGDILDKENLEKTILSFQPDIIFHLAAQPLVRRSYSEPLLTYQTNLIGTLHVLEVARKCKSVQALVNVTTDKCYENKEVYHGYSEEDTLGGYDMYSSSKACVELMSASYRHSFLQHGRPYAMATVRAGNVIGGGDWAQDRLIPDCIRAIYSDTDIILRNPSAIRPWQHVLEPLSGYLLVGEYLLTHGEEYAQAFNFGPDEHSVCTVSEITERIVSLCGRGNIIIEQNDTLHEAQLLLLSIDKAKEVLGWTPTYNIEQALEKTIEWYTRYYNKEDMRTYTLNQISTFEKDITWKKH